MMLSNPGLRSARLLWCLVVAAGACASRIGAPAGPVAATPTTLVINGPAEVPDVEILQDGKHVQVSLDGSTLRLRRTEFELRTWSGRIDVCLSRSAADLADVTPGIDTWNEEKTCF